MQWLGSSSSVKELRESETGRPKSANSIVARVSPIAERLHVIKSWCLLCLAGRARRGTDSSTEAGTPHGWTKVFSSTWPIYIFSAHERSITRNSRKSRMHVFRTPAGVLLRSLSIYPTLIPSGPFYDGRNRLYVWAQPLYL